MAHVLNFVPPREGNSLWLIVPESGFLEAPSGTDETTTITYDEFDMYTNSEVYLIPNSGELIIVVETTTPEKAMAEARKLWPPFVNSDCVAVRLQEECGAMPCAVIWPEILPEFRLLVEKSSIQEAPTEHCHEEDYSNKIIAGAPYEWCWVKAPVLLEYMAMKPERGFPKHPAVIGVDFDQKPS